ncbi:MAG: YraN family protein [Armatimonadota bacterium]
MVTVRSKLGNTGERLALSCLASAGYTVLQTNFRCRFGEIDIVARDGDCIVFVEVRTRRGATVTCPAESIGPRKQERLVRAAAVYLSQHNLWEKPCRFDVVEVVLTTALPPHTSLLKDAFQTAPELSP